MNSGPVQFRVGPLPTIRGLISSGVGPTQGLREFRAAGGQIRTQRWYAAYGELAAEAAVRPTVLRARPSRLPTQEEITQVTSARPGAFLYRGGVIVSVRTVDPVTGREIEQTQINWAGIRTGDLRDYEEIQRELENRFGPDGQSGTERSTVLGSFVSAVNELVPVAEEE